MRLDRWRPALPRHADRALLVESGHASTDLLQHCLQGRRRNGFRQLHAGKPGQARRQPSRRGRARNRQADVRPGPLQLQAFHLAIGKVAVHARRQGAVPAHGRLAKPNVESRAMACNPRQGMGLAGAQPRNREIHHASGLRRRPAGHSIHRHGRCARHPLVRLAVACHRNLDVARQLQRELHGQPVGARVQALASVPLSACESHHDPAAVLPYRQGGVG